jgi:primosomal replication protein N
MKRKDAVWNIFDNLTAKPELDSNVYLMNPVDFSYRKEDEMSEKVTIVGFVGLHPYIAYTSTGMKVLVFSLGSRSGRQAEYRQAVLQGEMAEYFQTQLTPGQRVMVVGALKFREGSHAPYLHAHEVHILSNQPQLTFDFAA